MIRYFLLLLHAGKLLTSEMLKPVNYIMCLEIEDMQFAFLGRGESYLSPKKVIPYDGYLWNKALRFTVPQLVAQKNCLFIMQKGIYMTTS